MARRRAGSMVQTSTVPPSSARRRPMRRGERRLADARPSRRTPRSACPPGRRRWRPSAATLPSPAASAAAMRSTAARPHRVERQERDDRGRQVDGRLDAAGVPARLLRPSRLQDRRRRRARGAEARASSLASRARSRRREARLGHGVHDEDAARDAEHLAHLRVELDGLVHRHLLREGHDGEGRPGRIDEQVAHPLRVAAQRPGGNGVDQHRRDAEELDGVAGGGRVHHHQVPAGAAALLRARLVEDLAEHDQLGERRDRAEEVAHHAVLEDRVVDGAELEDHEAVLAHGLARRDVDRGDPGQRLADRPGRPAEPPGAARCAPGRSPRRRGRAFRPARRGAPAPRTRWTSRRRPSPSPGAGAYRAGKGQPRRLTS